MCANLRKRKNESYSIFMRKLLTLVLPITFQQFMLALVSASDALMLGVLTQDALSAVSLASQVTFVESLFLGAMTIGLSMFAAQYWGKKDKAAVERIFAYVMKITVVVAFLFFVAGLSVPKALMRIFTNDKVLIENGAVYLRVVSISFLLTGISQNGNYRSCSCYGCGESNRSCMVCFGNSKKRSDQTAVEVHGS